MSGDSSREEAFARLQAINQSAPGHLMEIGEDGTVFYLNKATAGLERDEVVGQKLERWVEPASHEALRSALARVYATGETQTFEILGRVTQRWYEGRVSAIREDGRVSSAILVTQDITERKSLEDELRASEARFRALGEATVEGLTVAIGGRIVEANTAFARMLGYEVHEVIGKGPLDFTTPEDGAVVLARIREGHESPYEVTGIRRDGSRLPIEIVGRNVEWRGQKARVTAFRDLTERKRAEEERRRLEDQVRHAQRLETLGVLAGGIAHDFNNLLQAVRTEADVALHHTTETRVRESLQRIRQTATHATDLTRQLLAYGGRLPVSIDRLDLGAGLREMAGLIRVSIPSSAKLSLDLPKDGELVVRGDATQLRQVWLNLIVNASEALGSAAGTIDVRGGIARAGEPLGSLVLDSRRGEGGDLVWIEVADGGSGMSPDVASRIFEPFFSTKVQGRGLGLASVLGIVRSHHGAIALETAAGAGARFRVYLPRSTEEAPRATSKPPARSESTGGLILVADDEAAVRRVLKEALQVLGYHAELASTGQEALARFEEHKGDIRLALLDLTMPDGSGDHVAEELRRASPDLPLVVMSGHSDTRPETPGVHFLPKPFSLDDLERVLGETLG